MRRTTRLLVALLVALAALVSWTPQARAVGNSDAAAKAARYLASQVSSTSDVSSAADSLLGLAAAGDAGSSAQAQQLLTVVKNGAADYTKSPEGAAKLLLTAYALGQDPKSFAGVNLVDLVKAGVKPDGSFGANPSPFSSGLGMVALTRASEPIAPAMLQTLVSMENPDGGFGYAAGQASDADNTGMALLGLATQSDSISAKGALEKAVAWATASQQSDGSWKSAAGGNAVNSTAILGSALQAAGKDQASAVQYLVKQQLPDGSMPGEGKANLLATQQAALLLGNTSYLNVNNPALAAAMTTASASASPTASASSTASASASASASPSSSASSTAPSAPASAKATTPAAPAASDDDGMGWVALIALLLLAAAAVAAYFWNTRRKAEQADVAARAAAAPVVDREEPLVRPAAATEVEQVDDVPVHDGERIVGDDEGVADEFGLEESGEADTHDPEHPVHDKRDEN